MSTTASVCGSPAASRRPRGGVPGDLYVTVRAVSDERFERHGDDLLHVRSIALTQAALGCRLDIQTLDGDEELTSSRRARSPATCSGSRARRPALVGRGRGDLLVRADVEVPGRLSSEEEELLRQQAAAG
ncbi:MAG: DnaJ C-terminal domain-containing protein [Acidimicrobiia bacterium]